MPRMSKPKAKAKASPKPALTLVPTVHTMTREAIEAHISTVQSARMVAAVTYQEGVQAKIKATKAKLQTRLDKQCQLLDKQMTRIDELVEKLHDRVRGIEELVTEIEQAQELLDE